MSGNNVNIHCLILIILISLNCASSNYQYPAFLQKHRTERLDIFRQENKQLNDSPTIVFLGNSLTEGFPVSNFFPDLPILNRGIVADHIGLDYPGLLQRMKASIYDCHPKTVFIMIGVNDLADKNLTPKELIPGIKLLVNKIKTYDNDILIYLQSALPTTGKYAHLNPLISDYNQLLQTTALELNIQFINLHDHFIDDKGELNHIYSRDGVHINNEGYLLWKKIISSFLLPVPK